LFFEYICFLFAGYFSVGDNNLVGSIPSSFGKLTVLRQMFLNDNKLTGTIPMELSQMNYLSILSLEHNNLIGSIPSELARLEMLNELLLSGNNFEGSIPDEICVRGLDKLQFDSTVTCGCCSAYRPPLL
jgi:Leucine-rich repeat (LRR) protein